MAKSFSKIFSGEFIGTFVLVFCGCGAAIFAGQQIGTLGIAFAFGLSLLVMAYVVGPISGCHINPAVSMGMLVSKKISFVEFVYYVVSQLSGAFIAGCILYFIAIGTPSFEIEVNGFAANGFGAYSPGGYDIMQCAVIEVLMTAILVYTVLSTTHKKFAAGFGGLTVGLVLVLLHLVSIPITNASINPARSFGVAIIQGGWAVQQLWFFFVMPLAGGILGAIPHIWCKSCK